MKFVVKELTSFEVHEDGDTTRYSPAKAGVSVTPILINDSGRPVTLVTRGLKIAVRARNVAYLWDVPAFQGAVVLQSPSVFGLVTLKNGQMTSLEPFVLHPDDTNGGEFVVDYSVGDELRTEMEYWVGTVTGRLKLGKGGAAKE